MKTINFILLQILFFLLINSSFAQDTLKAQIGLKIITEKGSVKNERSALSTDRVRALDRLQIYVYPECDCILYVIHSDLKSASILVKDSLKKGSLYISPDTEMTYVVDGKSRKENIMIILTKNDFSNLELLWDTGTISLEKWNEFEKSRLNNASILKEETPEERISMAGNVRGDSSMDLKLYLGKSILIKKYSFDVKI